MKKRKTTAGLADALPGVSSAAYWWGRLAAAVGRLVYQVWAKNYAFQLLFADDIRWTAGGKDKFESIIHGLLIWIVVGAPVSWSKVRGGLKFDWLGYHCDYTCWKLGISELRAAWVKKWLGTLLEEGSMMVTRILEGLGRLGISSNALTWMKSFLAPLYACTAPAPLGAVLPLPKVCKPVVKWILYQPMKGRYL